MALSLRNVGKTVRDSVFGGKGSQATYTPPNVDFLRTGAPTVNYDFLRTPTDLTGSYKGQGDFTTAAPERGEGAFQDYLGAIKAPSSVDAVRTELGRDALESTIGQIEQDTKERFGKDLSSYFGRGLIDPGRGAGSDIASVGLAQVAASGAQTAADARTRLALGDIERLGAREEAERGAFGDYFKSAMSTDQQTRELTARAAAGDRDAYMQLVSQGADITGRDRLAYAEGMRTDADREAARRIALAQVLSGNAGAAADASRRTGQTSGLLDNVSFNFGFGGS